MLSIVSAQNLTPDGTGVATVVLVNKLACAGPSTGLGVVDKVGITDGQPYIPVVGATIEGTTTTVTAVTLNPDGTYLLALSTPYVAPSSFYLQHISYSMPPIRYIVGVNLMPQLFLPQYPVFLPNSAGMLSATLSGKLEILDKMLAVLSTVFMQADYTLFDPVTNYIVSSASWGGGTVTFTVAGTNYVQPGDTVTVGGLSPFGYNGAFTVIGVAGNDISCAMASDPGSFVSGGFLVGGGGNFTYSVNVTAYSQNADSFDTFSAIRCTPTGGDTTIAPFFTVGGQRIVIALAYLRTAFESPIIATPPVIGNLNA